MSDLSVLKKMLLLTVLIFGAISYNMLPKNYHKSVVKLYGLAGSGSGSVVESNSKYSIILTNRHVCDGVTLNKQELETLTRLEKKIMSCMVNFQEDCIPALIEYKKLNAGIQSMGRNISVKFNNYNHQDVVGKVIKLSEKADLCLIKINLGNLPTIQLSRENAAPLQHIFSIGNPLNMTNHLTDGYVGDSMTDNGRVYQLITAEIWPGNSGGPTVNYRGELVGVNTLKGQVATENYMIPLDVVKDFLGR